nr:MAG TPA: hypothetical protein [Caudoviricetes sp.]
MSTSIYFSLLYTTIYRFCFIINCYMLYIRS